MSVAERARIGLVSLACLAALLLDVYPGLLGDVLARGILMAVCMSPIVGLVLLILLIGEAMAGRLRRLRLNLKVIKWEGAIMLVTLALLVLNVPQRIGFALSKGAFESLLASLDVSIKGHVNVQHRVGVYFVDKVDIDSRGGVFFRTRAVEPFLGFGVTSSGFAHQPRPDSLPLGATHYDSSPLGDDWHVFTAAEISD